MSQKWSIRLNAPVAGRSTICLSGSWCSRYKLPETAVITEDAVFRDGISAINFDVKQLADWDTGLVCFIVNLGRFCKQSNITLEIGGLPDGVQGLLRLALAVPPKEQERTETRGWSFLEDIGNSTSSGIRGAGEFIAFLGSSTQALWAFCRGKAQYRRVDLVRTIQDCGPQALPIVTLISMLVGLILAYIGAVQLEQFGAEIYVANLVGLAMMREMGAIMAGIIMAGRTGAAFAAQLGTMQVNEEIDALRTVGISPIEFLVLPRMLALILMMPLLCIYADLMGIIGGMLVGVGSLDISLARYIDQTGSSLGVNDILVGVGKSVVFGILVALCGCLCGMQCGRSSSAVGQAATSAVVWSIVAIIVADAIFAVILNMIGF